MEIDTPIKIFLSHSSDEDYRKVKDILMKESMNIELYIFPDYNKLELDFIDGIRQTIEEVDLFMVILNEKGRSKQWVNQEVGVAVAKEKDIIVIAEKEAIDEKKLEGFINDKNRTILAIDKDDFEEQLIQWLKEYTEEHEMIFLQRDILEFLAKLRRIMDAQKIIYKEKGIENINQHLNQLDTKIIKLFELFRNEDLIFIQRLIHIKTDIDEAQKLISDRDGKTVVIDDKLLGAINNSEIQNKIDRYIELRKMEY